MANHYFEGFRQGGDARICVSKIPLGQRADYRRRDQLGYTCHRLDKAKEAGIKALSMGGGENVRDT